MSVGGLENLRLFRVRGALDPREPLNPGVCLEGVRESISLSLLLSSVYPGYLRLSRLLLIHAPPGFLGFIARLGGLALLLAKDGLLCYRLGYPIVDDAIHGG